MRESSSTALNQQHKLKDQLQKANRQVQILQTSLDLMHLSDHSQPEVIKEEVEEGEVLTQVEVDRRKENAEETASGTEGGPLSDTARAEAGATAGGTGGSTEERTMKRSKTITDGKKSKAKVLLFIYNLL